MGALGAAGCSRVAEAGEVEGGDLLERLRDRGSVKVGIASERPFGYVNEEGDVTGEAPEIARVIFRRLGIDEVTAVTVDFSSLIPGLKAQLFDVVSAGMYINPDRCAQVLFSDPDYLMKDAFIVAKGNPFDVRDYEQVGRAQQQEGLKFATGDGYAQSDYAEAAGVTNIQVFPDQTAGLEAVATGRVDVFAGTNVTVKNAVEGNNRVEGTEPFQPYVDGEPAYGAGGFAFRTSEDNLRDAFNVELHKLKRNDYEELLSIVSPFGFTKAEMTDMTAKELC